MGAGGPSVSFAALVNGSLVPFGSPRSPSSPHVPRLARGVSGHVARLFLLDTVPPDIFSSSTASLLTRSLETRAETPSALSAPVGRARVVRHGGAGSRTSQPMDLLAGSTTFIFSSSHSPLAPARVFAGADTARDVFHSLRRDSHGAWVVVPRAPSRVLRSIGSVSARGRNSDGIAAVVTVGYGF